MNAVTRERVQTLVKQLPQTELSIAHDLLVRLLENKQQVESPQEKLMKLPLEERRKILAQQAAAAAGYYEGIREEIDEWLVGDFIFVEEQT